LTANGPVVSTAGFHFPTLMVVIRLDGGDLFIWSPIALTDDLKAAVADWPAESLLMAHGAPVLKNGQASIATAFRWLTG